MVQPLNMRTVLATVSGVKQYVQDKKIEISRHTIRKMQDAGRWSDEYISFVGSEGRAGRYPDPERFFTAMHNKPDWYARKFIFRPLGGNGKDIREAVLYAYNMVIQQTRFFKVSTGFYANSLRIAINNSLATLTDLNNINGDAVASIYNVAPYAGAMEVNKLYYQNIGGVIFYAANMVAKKYPQLGVRFEYKAAKSLPGTFSRYNVPVLRIGSRSNVVDSIDKPGRNMRGRKRGKIYDYTNRRRSRK